jgi:hypothetical protein
LSFSVGDFLFVEIVKYVPRRRERKSFGGCQFFYRGGGYAFNVFETL